MSPEELALRTERLRVLFAVNGAEAVLDPSETHLPDLTERERQLMMGAEPADLDLAASCIQAARFLRQMQWVAMQELLPLLRPGEAPWETYEHLHPADRRYFLLLLQASGWWSPPPDV